MNIFSKLKKLLHKDVVYYAHSLRKYNTEQEQSELELLERKFGKVYNPNRLEINNHPDPMKICLEKVAECDILAFSIYDNHIGMGVYLEIKKAQELKKPVYLIHNHTVQIFNGNLKIVGKNWAVKYAQLDNDK